MITISLVCDFSEYVQCTALRVSNVTRGTVKAKSIILLFVLSGRHLLQHNKTAYSRQYRLTPLALLFPVNYSERINVCYNNYVMINSVNSYSYIRPCICLLLLVYSKCTRLCTNMATTYQRFVHKHLICPRLNERNTINRYLSFCV